MRASGAQAAAFFREVARHRTVWWVRDDQGSPAPLLSTGERAFPYWSSEFRPVSMALETWRTRELPDLAKDNFRIGINWSGPRLTGWDFTPDEVVSRLAHALGEPPFDSPSGDKGSSG
ncbi:hypothetical protein AB0J72_18230 [Dactylosporangium sp. NPDC049742]|uniref:DUF2750 domain-containing protein n=1 Tax=Dactylosporangium sp. NPDC049742 TaxID=3154737 RepID=UPI003429279A